MVSLGKPIRVQRGQVRGRPAITRRRRCQPTCASDVLLGWSTMSIVSATRTDSYLMPASESGGEASTLTVDLPGLHDWIESLGGESAIAASPTLVELLQVVRNALAHHMRVVVQIAPVGPRDEDISEWRSQLEHLIEQMTPELSLPTEPKLRQARRNAEARTQLLQEFGALTGDQIGEEHSRAQNRHALAARWRKEGRIFGVPYRGQTLYPAFQFDTVSNGVKPSIRDVLDQLPRDRMSEWEIALWWTAANGWLGGRRPVDVLRDDPEAVTTAAARLGAPRAL